MARDNFTQNVKNILKDRVGGRCSNPLCMRDTVGPKGNIGSAVSVGEAAHICAASQDGPRFDPNMTEEERKSEANGIWLCSTCHSLVDSDPESYPAEVLRKWKNDAEYAQYCRLHGRTDCLEAYTIDEKLKVLQLIKQNFDSLHERLTYAYGLWESNFSRFMNEYDLQNEIDEHWELYKDNLQEIYKFNTYVGKMNEVMKQYSLFLGKTISEFIISYLNRINFHYEHDQIGIYNNYWSKFFEMLEENYEELDDLKEQFDGECFKLCE